MKNWIACGVKAVLALLASAAFAATAVHAQPIRIGIANFGEHGQLNEAISGFKKALAEEGFVEGRDVTFTVSHTNFDPSLVPQMLERLKAERPKLVLTVTTPVSQIAKRSFAGTGIPVVFTAVTDPVAAKLVPSWSQGDVGMTGSSDLQDLGAILKFARKLVPHGRSFGLPYNPGEANDVALLDKLKQLAPAEDFEVVAVGVDNVNEIAQRIASFQRRADVIYVPTSNLLQPALPAVAAVARRMGVPLLNADDKAVRNGDAVASVAVGYEGVGRNAGKLAAKILKGADPKTLAPTKPTIEEHSTVISRKALAAYKVKLPEALASCGCLVD